MLKNYLLVAYRNLLRHKGFSFINIAGLALGITACLLIGLFVADELQYDRFMPDGERVYRVATQNSKNGELERVSFGSPMFAPTLQQELPEVEQAVRLMSLQSKLLFRSADGKLLYQEDGFVADPTVFSVLQVPFRYGTPAQALTDPRAIVLSEQMAEQFFGPGNPIGRELKLDTSTFRVTGVLQNQNLKFHLNMNFVTLLTPAAIGVPEARMKSWGWRQFQTYAKLRPGTDPAAVEAKFQRYLVDKVKPQLKSDQHLDYTVFLQPLHQVYLHSADFKINFIRHGNITYVRALGIIAGAILLIACFNFVNLATAKSMQRAKEVGIRKTIGASQRQLMLQFLAETLLLTLLSVVLATVLTGLLLPYLNVFTAKQMSFNLLQNPVLLAVLLGLTVLVGLGAGFYPALVLASFKPVKVLKSAVVTDGLFGRVQWLRHGLIVVQFALSVFLIVSAIVVFRQVAFLHNKDLGFNKDQIMFFPMRGDNMTRNYQAFQHELEQAPGVASASIGYGFPGDIFAGDGIEVPVNGEMKEFSVTQLLVDYHYVPTLGLKLVAGRNFSEAYKSDPGHAFIINETAVRVLGFPSPDKAVGQTMQWKVWNDRNPDSVKVGKVIGVVQDFNYKSLYDQVEPTVLQIFPEANWKVAVKLKGDVAAGVASVKQVWAKFSPDNPIEFRFMDDNFDEMYRAEDKLQTLLFAFTGVAIFVGCLGLFGLATYAAERRKKEIGIRKVLGADVLTIVGLLSKEFLVLVAVATLLAFPAAWLALSRWLQDFAYRIDMPLWAFAAAGLLAAAVAFLTVGYQAVRAATANPIKNLRVD
ncbi:FtsX-like permease family protein [Hymenobacter busanensis]|uniref:FtsX-like permease family protein n=1 Tax=Hymenobacter busanensis TaxID=2607656 RepID=A0A7L4ZVM0_9BACT|nr:ABC transporter permease [Hymenobacter busanensis]KAA9339215.1 FtsX-like permease family protein [Hymenobacter busanensis]QHJ07023.1 FtsX-like permease family protein [Hymenobacter busanensis]